jgi:DNA polymerase III psi subunit
MERPVLLLKRILPSLSIHSLALVDIDPAIMGMLENGIIQKTWF